MYSYSKVSCWWQCPYLYKLKYIDKLEEKFDEDPRNALLLGTAIHEGIETQDIDKAINEYLSKYKEITPQHELEVLKLKTILPIAIKQIPRGLNEEKILYHDFIGFIDLLVEVEDGVYDLYDYKYSANIDGYTKSGQIHLYKYFFEKQTGKKIRNLYYVFIPKDGTVLKEGLDFEETKKKVESSLLSKNIRFEKIEYDPKQISHFFARKTLMEKDTEFNKRFSFSCKWCSFKKFCESKGLDRSEINEKTEI